MGYVNRFAIWIGVFTRILNRFKTARENGAYESRLIQNAEVSGLPSPPLCAPKTDQIMCIQNLPNFEFTYKISSTAQ